MGKYFQKYLSSGVFKKEQLFLCFGTHLTDNQGHQSLFTAHSSQCWANFIVSPLHLWMCPPGTGKAVGSTLLYVNVGFGVDGAYVWVSIHLISPTYCVSFTPWRGLDGHLIYSSHKWAYVFEDWSSVVVILLYNPLNLFIFYFFLCFSPFCNNNL